VTAGRENGTLKYTYKGKGSLVVVVCEGIDAAEAMAALARVFESGFGER
jgi:phosphotransferase system HPr-like phosphotransfer protein